MATIKWGKMKIPHRRNSYQVQSQNHRKRQNR